MLIIKKPEGKRVSNDRSDVLSGYERYLLSEAIREDSEMLRTLVKM